jgi:hypothetical protein
VNALGAFANAVTHARTAHGDRPDAGHDLAFGQMAVTHQPPAAVFGQFVGMAAEQGRDFGLNSLAQKCSCTIAQNLG